MIQVCCPNSCTNLGYALDPSALQDALISQESNAATYVCEVYEQETQVIGFIATARLFYLPTLQHLTRVTALYVDQHHRHSGIGHQLLEFVEELATHRGDWAVEATCALYRQRTHSFYIQQGYAKHSYKFIKNLSLQ